MQVFDYSVFVLLVPWCYLIAICREVLGRENGNYQKACSGLARVSKSIRRAALV